MTPTVLEIVATSLFLLAVIHTFLTSKFQKIGNRYPDGSVGENFFHLLGEVEVVFGLWAGALIAGMAVFIGSENAIKFTESLNFTEPAFVFAIMVVAATRPVMAAATFAVRSISRIIPVQDSVSFFFTALIVGPLLGSLITEPAAMTVSALLLRDIYFNKDASHRLKYMTLATLFVNISIGGVLTNFAAPPVIMVANAWDWSSAYMFDHFGWKALVGVILNTSIATALMSKELKAMPSLTIAKKNQESTPWWLVAIHLGVMAFIVATSHHMVIFMGILMFFLGVVAITVEYQDPLKLRESLLVGFFLAGLVVLGSLQKWWLKPIIEGLGELPLFLGATALTAFTDNAALTFLASQVEGLAGPLKYAVVAGAVAGGGLTVIANAPNPAGYAILREQFGKDGISAITLFCYAAVPTLVAMSCFWFFPR